MKNIYCGRSEFIKAIKRNCVNHFLHLFVEATYNYIWFCTQKAVWNYKFLDTKDLAQLQIITKHLKVDFRDWKPECKINDKCNSL